jgi:GT2 family glycosyltransferase
MQYDRNNKTYRGGNMKVSVCMSTFNRDTQLSLGLRSMAYREYPFELEIIVVDDGMPSADGLCGVDSVCNFYRSLDIRYIFSGARNLHGIVKRNPGMPNNIAVKASTGDIIILTCPEMYHINNCFELLVNPLLENKKLLTIPEYMYFEDTDGNGVKSFSDYMIQGYNDALLPLLRLDKESVQMPFLMGMWKEEFMKIGGYDEDMNGYAGEDNDLVDRLQWNGCKYHRVPAQVVHLYHGPRCDSQEHFEDPAWKHNYDVRKAGRGKIVRNVGREWGCNHGIN